MSASILKLLFGNISNDELSKILFENGRFRLEDNLIDAISNKTEWN